MSDERFFKSHYTEHIIDKANDKCYPIRNVMGVDDLVDLLNSLSEENEQLKQSNDRFADTVAKQVSLLIELRKENEQLQKQVKSFETTMNATSDYNAFLESKITTLEKENEQLRKELDNFKPVMFQDVRKGTVILYSKGDIDE